MVKERERIHTVVLAETGIERVGVPISGKR